MAHWYMLTVVGEDQPGIVAKISQTLFHDGGNLGETSMMRLGGNFTIMMMVSYATPRPDLLAVISPVTDALGLRAHIDPIEGHLHSHKIPNARITVFGADRAGIVAQVTQTLAQHGFDILDLGSDVGGTRDKPLYVMQIEGSSKESVEQLRHALQPLVDQGIDARISEIETLIG